MANAAVAPPVHPAGVGLEAWAVPNCQLPTAQQQPTDPPHTHIRKLSLGENMKFIKGARNGRPI